MTYAFYKQKFWHLIAFSKGKIYLRKRTKMWLNDNNILFDSPPSLHDMNIIKN